MKFYYIAGYFKLIKWENVNNDEILDFYMKARKK
jgi:hypothetical protein